MGLSLDEPLLPRPLSAPPACHPDWPLAPLAQPQLLQTLTPCQKAELSGHLFTLKVFLKKEKKKAPDCYCLRRNWACKNIKARIAWACDEVREAEGREEGTSNKTPHRKMRGRKGEKIKQQGIKDITAIPWNMWRQARWKCPHTGPQVTAVKQSSNDCHYQTLSQPIISWPLLVWTTQHVTSSSNQCKPAIIVA